MAKTRQLRWFEWVAVVLIAAALVLMLVPQSHATATPDWLAMLPVFFIGLVVPFRLTGCLPVLNAAPASSPAIRRTLFQRPPPSQLL